MAKRKKSKRRGRWVQRTLKLKDHHGWRAKPGYNVFVADRGAFRFNYPHEWLVRPDEDCIRFYDAEPPDDNFTLGVSYLRLAPIDWSGLPLGPIVRDLAEKDEREIIEIGEVVEPNLGDVEAAWVELSHIDPLAKRKAYGRYGLARGSNIQVLLTLDYWPEDAPKVRPAWDEVLRSLVLGRYFKDPTVGELLH